MNKKISDRFFVDKTMKDIYDNDFQVRQLTNFGVTVKDNLLTYLMRYWERHCYACKWYIKKCKCTLS